jgi:hypothetical protein
VDCAATEFFRTTEPISGLLEEDLSALRLPHVRDQFAAVLAAGLADARPDELDWDRIIANWDLPLRKRGRRRS